jgi:hypothetical protein
LAVVKLEEAEERTGIHLAADETPIAGGLEIQAGDLQA